MAGWLFNFVFTQTVINMSSGIKNIGAIDVAWKTMRDLSNICFIFILLYLAISTILGVGEHDVKKTLSKLIVVAILINFSLLFTEMIIDVSNILAVAFYNAITVTGGTGGIGDAFMNAFRLSSIYSTTGIGPTSGAQAFASGNQHISVLIGGAFAMIVAIAVLLSALMMFIKRYIILVLVMIFSPVAFAGMVLHQTEHAVKQWWDYLLKEAFFAPVYMIMLWISFTIITNPGFITAIYGPNANANATLAQGLTANDYGNANNSMAGVLLDFMIVSALLIASLIVAEHMGVVGSQAAMHSAESIIGKGVNGLAMPFSAAYRKTQ